AALSAPNVGAGNRVVAPAMLQRRREVMKGSAQLQQTLIRRGLWQQLQRGEIASAMSLEVCQFIVRRPCELPQEFVDRVAVQGDPRSLFAAIREHGFDGRALPHIKPAEGTLEQR